MFARFTRTARTVVTAAYEEAAALRHDAIGAEHLLLALAQDGPGAQVLGSLGLSHDALRAEVEQLAGGLDADALATIGIDLDAVRRKVEASFGPGALPGRPCGRRAFTARAKRVMERSVKESVALHHRDIRPEHLLLGVAGESEGIAAAALTRCGQSPEALRTATLAAVRRAA